MVGSDDSFPFEMVKWSLFFSWDIRSFSGGCIQVTNNYSTQWIPEPESYQQFFMVCQPRVLFLLLKMSMHEKV